MAPVQRALVSHPGIDPQLISTGQHAQIFTDALACFGLKPDLSLPPLDRPLAVDEMVAHLAQGLLPILRANAPELVLVHGDTNSTIAAAQAGQALGIPIGHVEAGLRSHDLTRPWPEEGHRIATDRIATLLFAPGPVAMANLAEDPLVTGQCHLTGNSGIDALFHILESSPRILPQAGVRRLIVTLHRREVIGEPLRAMCAAIRALADRPDVEVLLPVHTNRVVRAIVNEECGGHPAIALVEPLSYPEMVAQMSAAALILSDSGGVQEEAPALGVPLLILRDVTERPEAVQCGGAILVGTDPIAVHYHAARLLDDPAALRAMARPAFPFGRGDASSRIVTVIEKYLGLEKVT